MSGSRSTIKVLVVEDDQGIRDILEILLRGEGAQVETAKDGFAAINHVKNGFVPTLILLDLMMPGLDGQGLIELLRTDEDLSKVPVVVMSGQTGARQRAAEMSAADCLIKPVNLEELLSVVHRYGTQEA